MSLSTWTSSAPPLEGGNLHPVHSRLLASRVFGRQASAATWEEDSTWEDAPAQMVVTEKLLAEQIQQLATSKNFVDMSINDIRAKLACTFDQDLSAHRKTIKRIVKTYAGIT